MKYEVILEKTIALFSTMADTEDEITADSELIEELGISSMDVLFLITCLEEEFKIKVPEREIRKMYTVGDVVESISGLVKSK